MFRHHKKGREKMLRTITVVAGIILGCAASASAQTLVKTFSSALPDGKFGFGVHRMPDVNGDSIADLLIVSGGSSVDGANLGRIEIRSGSSYAMLLEIDGTVGNTIPFWASTPQGDVNADGISDILVGDPGLGKVQIYSGASGSLLEEVSGETLGDGFGYSVAALPDINIDGIPDFAVGAPIYSEAGKSTNGYVRFFSGADGAEIGTVYGDGTNDKLGAAIAYAGDVNNDSVPDLVAGAPEFGNTLTGKGYVRVYTATNRSTILTIAGPTVGSRFGSAVAAAADVNADSFDDLIVGAPLDRAKGSVFVHSGNGGTELFEVRGGLDGDLFGSFVAGVSDVNNDSIPDFVGAAPTGDVGGTPNGYLRIYLGSTGASYKYFKGKIDGGLFGYSVASVGDIDGNNTPNILIGAPGVPSRSLYSETPDGTVQLISIVTSLSSQDPTERGSRGQRKPKSRGSRIKRGGQL